MPHKTPSELESFLAHYRLSMRIEFDGANKVARVFSACLPGMRVDGGRKSTIVIAHSASPAAAVSALAGNLKDTSLRADDGAKRMVFPTDLDAGSLVNKLTPITEVEKLALGYLTDVAVRMAVAFSVTREGQDGLWHATMGASLVNTVGDEPFVGPITIVNERPLRAMEEIAWKLGGRRLLRRDMEFRAPVLPNVRHAHQEEIRTVKKTPGK